jgi:hypothetical protein
MAESDFTIKVSKDAVDVRYTPSASEPRGKLFGFIFVLVTLAAVPAALLFLPGKHGNSSMLHDMQRSSFGSSGFLFPLILLVAGTGLLAWQGLRYARAAWPSDETFHGDREAITISRVPWLDFSNRTWRTQTYPLAEVSAIRFAVIASAKGRSFWGIRFRARGRKWALPGLEASQAKTILAGLQPLGADVPDDPKLDKRIKQEREMQDGDTSWMDTSWMDHDKDATQQDAAGTSPDASA